MVGVFAGDCLHRDGLSDAQFVTSGKFAGGHQLAARITGDIGENALDVTNSVLLQKGEAIRCGMELDCRYADVIVKRMLKLDKTLKIKKNGIDETETWLKLIE